MIGEFESTLARIMAAEEQAVQAVEEACCTQEEARHIHAEVMNTYIGALTMMGLGNSVMTSRLLMQGMMKNQCRTRRKGTVRSQVMWVMVIIRMGQPPHPKHIFLSFPVLSCVC
jgi:hypothetical protein